MVVDDRILVVWMSRLNSLKIELAENNLRPNLLTGINVVFY